MVSFNSLLLVVTLAVAANGYSHHGLHKRAQIHPRHFTNGTTTEPSYPIGTGVEPPVEYPDVEEPTQTHGPTGQPTTTCITEITTKTYTYTLGNGHAVTTCITKTNLITKTISPYEATPTGGSVHTDGPQEPSNSFSSTTTSTTTELLTLTRPHPDGVPTPDAGANDVPSCSPVTVYIPETVYITVPQSVVTVTVAPAPQSEYPTVHPELPVPTEEPTGYPEPPVPTTEPTYTAPHYNTTAPYQNSTVPSTTSTRYVTLVPYQ